MNTLQNLVFIAIILGFLAYGGFRFYNYIKGGIKDNETNSIRSTASSTNAASYTRSNTGSYESYRARDQFKSN